MIFSTSRKWKIAGRAARNLVTGRPITVSFEITYNCNANCAHCHLGEPIPRESRVGAKEYLARMLELSPVAVQISGGEPMMRKDLVEIISELRRHDEVAVFVMTTNAHMLNEEKYFQLREAGMEQYSISLDYPDERHDEFRQLKGCFAHLNELLPKLAAHNNEDLVLATVVQSQNYRDLPKMAELAKQWGVCINYSIYTHLRTQDKSWLINPNGQLDELRRIVDQLIDMQAKGYPISTSPYSLKKMLDFYATGELPDCQAGRKFLIINPMGQLSPCGMITETFDSLAEIKKGFAENNTCTACYTASRANSEKPLSRMLLDGLRVARG